MTSRSDTLDLNMALKVEGAIQNRLESNRFSLDEESVLDFLQMRASYHVTGRAGDRNLDFTATGAAETFRGRVPTAGDSDR